jgi:DNA-binding response OmpR family regulator
MKAALLNLHREGRVPAMRILIVEDDRKMAVILREGLEKQMHRVETAFSGTEGLAVATAHTFEAIVLDVMLPGMDGFLVAKNLREARVLTPILMLTARDAKADIVRGLDNGVDDYLTKPFAFQELFARLRAISRRPATPPELFFELEDLRLDPRTHIASRAGRPLSLTRTEFLILEFMMRHSASVLRREEIIHAVWGHEEKVENNTLDVFVKQLRAKVDEGAGQKLIHTVRGFGYQLAAMAR